MKELTVDEIIAKLDKTIIGQAEAKIVVANAFRDRFRRTLLPAELKRWVSVKNILLKGESGTGKTEIARQVAEICNCPFITIDATTLTAAGYIGGDISSSIRRLVKEGEKMYPKAVREYRAMEEAKRAAENKAVPDTRTSFLQDLRDVVKYCCDNISSTQAKKALRAFGKELSKQYKTGKIDIKSFELYITGGTRIKTIKYCFEFACEVEKGKYDDKLKLLLAYLILAYTLDGVWATTQGASASEMSAVETSLDKLYADLFIHNKPKAESLERLFKANDVKSFEAEEAEHENRVNEANETFSSIFGKMPAVWFTGDRKLKKSRLIDADYKPLEFLNLILDGAAAKKGTNKTLPPELKDYRSYVENYAIVFIDEIDKLVPRPNQSSGVGNIDVQYELLKVLEGGSFDLDANNSHRDAPMGTLKTDNILFLCAGAFANVSEEGLISEIRGRLPISVTLHPLEATDIVRIMRESNKSPIKEIQEKAKTQGVTVEFTDDAIIRLAELSAEYNRNEVNLGARRIVSFIERVNTYATIKDPMALKYNIDLKMVEEALGKYFDENLHMYKIKELKGSLDDVMAFFKSPHTSPLIPYRNKELLSGRKYFITNHEYRLLAAVARGLQWNSERYEELTREACRLLFTGKEKHGGLLEFISKNIDTMIPNVDDFHLMDREELLNTSIIVQSYHDDNSEHYKLIAERLASVLSQKAK